MSKREILYVPVLKTKAGERWALSHLKAASKARIRPLMEFHENQNKALGDHIQAVCEAFQSAWGVDRWLYIDTIWLHGNSGSPSVIGAVFEAAEASSLQALPVIRTSYDDASLEQLQAVISENDRGCLLRVTPEVLDTPSLIDAVIQAVEVPPKRVDFLLDYRQHAMSLTTDVQRIPHLNDWRAIITASGVFPRSLASIPLHNWESINRYDWTSWRNGVQSGLPRNPIYSDYGMRAPGAPADFGAPSVNLRYALETAWLIQMGGKHADGAAPEMHSICDDLINRSEYCGEDFSTGDEEISRVSDEEEGPGGPTQWLQWSLSHHLEFAMHQLSHGEV
jgi:hypothetical protein